MQRTGSSDIVERTFGYRTLGTNGYVRVTEKNHPLATKDGFVYEHRKVLFDAIGVGPHRCNWCDATVSWVKGKCIRGSLVPDHLDGDKANNLLENLVPACNACNAARGLFLAWLTKHGMKDPFIQALYEKATGLPASRLPISGRTVLGVSPPGTAPVVPSASREMEFCGPQTSEGSR